MNAREKVWSWIEAHRHGDIVHGSSRRIAEEVGIGHEWVRTILKGWCDEGSLIHVEYDRRRIVSAPDLTGFVRAEVWTPEARARLAELSASGVPISQIAREMKVTPSAVTGQRARMGLPKRPSPIRRAGEGAR